MAEQERYEDSELYKIRHSAAHVMAQAVMEMFPKGKYTIGPPVENGFYYDFDLPRTLTPEDLKKIQKRTRKILNGKHEFLKQILSADEAREIFKEQTYKLELIEGLEEGGFDEYGNPLDEKPDISTYTHDSFVDLCRGPHVDNTGDINPKAVKLMSIAGAYWRGDENNPQLQRIYGTAWNTKEELDAYLWRLEEAKKRDHRKLGKELDIYTFDEEVGPGLPLWLPNGAVIIEELEMLAKQMEREAGYKQVRSPHLTKEDLFIRSGHLPYYAESMYPPMEMEGGNYYIKPMNCPMHHKIFDARPRSYRDLPVRLSEYGTCYRYEKSGELFGLMRVRSMQMNDAHIYCSEAQFEEEFMAVIDLYMKYFEIFNIEKYVMRFSTHAKEGLGKKYIDNEPLWLKTEEMVRRAMKNGGVRYVEVADEAAFYGPKIDVQVWSAIGKEFTLATNQVDFSVPEKFGLHFTNSQGEDETPLCIHRAPLSTHERMIGFLIEHYAGVFPVWIAPVQAVLIPITDDHLDYAYEVKKKLVSAGIRAEVAADSGRMGAKIRKAQKKKIPYMLVVGDAEMEANAVALRMRDGEDRGAIPVDDFITLANNSIADRA
ncbi:MAG: threonine--tRNA ligase [Anaerolineae bacterium]|jgi:threonyl-tRNA synthetase|nr:threonine--tRNA ligase [Anaerolineae bacterium]MBT3712409.1 threonine--tRNA ligase [Anaerolineae bacterium]MBT4312269.1 threonine--tRNA ligase [Anaerolineae bacterium]MBT6060402.1 threonine--tRNA ligase [Anaerolineae bacterium]MBT6321996.1 threonine--tRNA ligase [Anaerolineae bacterium]